MLKLKPPCTIQKFLETGVVVLDLNPGSLTAPIEKRTDGQYTLKSSYNFVWALKTPIRIALELTNWMINGAS